MFQQEDEKTVIFHTEEGLYTRNVCVYRQFWHFSIIISLIINLNFYFQVSRITNGFSVYLLDEKSALRKFYTSAKKRARRKLLQQQRTINRLPLFGLLSG